MSNICPLCKKDLTGNSCINKSCSVETVQAREEVKPANEFIRVSERIRGQLGRTVKAD